MSDDTKSPPEAPVAPADRPVWQRLSIVWIVPLVALVVVLAIAWQNYADRGPLIEIGFENASGVRAGSTELRYRDVKVGLVEEVGFARGLGQVLVKVRLDQDVAPYVDGDARFWVVRPQVTTQGVSGLDTVLSGVFIEGLWDNEPGPATARFEGLADAPLERLGHPGAAPDAARLGRGGPDRERPHPLSRDRGGPHRQAGDFRRGQHRRGRGGDLRPA